MDFKQIQEDVKGEVGKNWKVIAIVAAGIFILAIIIGLTTKKDEPEEVRQDAMRKTDLTRIYMDAMENIDPEVPKPLIEMDIEKASKNTKMPQKASKVKKEDANDKNKEKNVSNKNMGNKKDASKIILPQEYMK